tara:strand:+ start:7478 stop:9340 length:1863 start_codon:yes stop_codon:yes gene_type:complete
VSDIVVTTETVDVTSLDKATIIASEFRTFMCEMSSSDDPRAATTFYELAASLGAGHSCLDLTTLTTGEPLKEWKTFLKSLSVVTDVTDVAETRTDHRPETPIILDGNRLYMQRYYLYEKRVAAQLTHRNQSRPVPHDGVTQDIVKLNAGNDQKTAIYLALHRNLTIITGGPGTGKTTTVAHLIRLYRSAMGDDDTLRIRVAAPTGKAANRLAEALADTDQGEIPVSTLHRLLGQYADGRGYRHGPQNPLIVDLLVVDEVSMINLAMMDRLLAALPETARLVLLGDSHQLPSVSAGNVLADLGQSPSGFSDEMRSQIESALGFDPDQPTPEVHHHLQDATIQLNRNYRFTADAGIGRLATEVVEGVTPTLATVDPELTLAQHFQQVSPVALVPLEVGTDPGRRLLEMYASYFALLQGRPDVSQLLAAFEQARILCPTHEGILGVNAINAFLIREARRRLSLPADPRSHEFFHGRPIIITRNDYNLGLFNGDIGICFEDEGRTKVAFQNGETTQELLAARLPEYDTCFAMTIHKAQGSEFDHTMVLLPPAGAPPLNQLVTRQLLYTSVTRARKSVTLLANRESLASAISQNVNRMSGLSDRLIAEPLDQNPPVNPTDQLTLF